ncbi:MAG: alpha/beta fold hydrolase [Acidobacteriota bacterium]
MIRPISLTLTFVLTGTAASPYTITRETATTTDGVTLAMKRYKSGGTPVILCHGIVQNQACMDLAVPGSSLAVYLADHGYDVWDANLRSHGKGTYKSGSSGNWDWSIDEFAAFDVPAIVNKVKSATGKKPFWIGHSMGGMVAYGYLQGVKIQNVKVDEVWGWGWCGPLPCYEKLYDVYGKRVVKDPSLASTRNAGLRGLVTIASPVRMKWKYDVSIWNWWLYDYYDYNLIVNELARSDAANDALESVGYLPFGTLTTYLSGDVRNLPYVGGPLADFLQWVFGNVGTSYLTAQVWYPPNMNPQISQAVINDTIDDTESRVCQQFLDGARNKTWRVPHRRRSTRPTSTRTTTAPLRRSLRRRRHQGQDVQRRHGLLRRLPEDGQRRSHLARLRKLGHDDLVLGVEADTQVYPFMS